MVSLCKGNLLRLLASETGWTGRVSDSGPVDTWLQRECMELVRCSASLQFVAACNLLHVEVSIVANLFFGSSRLHVQ